LDKKLTTIDAFREKIDDLDKKIIRLLNQRAHYADQIGHIKRALNLPVYVPSREEQVIEHVQTYNPGPLSAEAIRRLYERIIDESRRLERENFERLLVERKENRLNG